jgi:AmmeMemoRadiSam system protein A
MPCLSESERKSILELGRQAVVEAVSHKRQLEEIPNEPVFAPHYGVFVTLHVAGKLRGCIGVIEAKENLGASLAKCAFGAAREDPRFTPVQPEELLQVHIEISLLSPLQPILPEQIEIGKHGLLIEQGFHRGLLLPQVAVEHRLGREEFLRETCHKAGLPVDAWEAPGTRIYGFTCEILLEFQAGA